MKNCKYCKSQMDNSAKICPTCHKKQTMPLWLIILLIIIGISLLSTFISNDNEVDKPSGSTTTKETLTLMEGHSGRIKDNWTYEISGTIQNNTDKDYSYVQIEFYTYDAEGNLLDTCFANNSGLEALGKWKFTADCWFADGEVNQVSSYKLKEITKW